MQGIQGPQPDRKLILLVTYINLEKKEEIIFRNEISVSQYLYQLRKDNPKKIINYEIRYLNFLERL